MTAPEVVPSAERFAGPLRRPGPDSLVFQRFLDDKGLMIGGTTLLMQVAHPAVGAGVAQHSNFQAEPWRRLYGTLMSISTIVYARDDKAVAEVNRLREMHRTIRGLDESGHKYSALQPGPWAWVHATLAWAVIRLNELSGTAFTAAEADAYWRDWLDVGTLLGVRPGDLPATWPEAERYFASTAAELFRDNRSVRDVAVAIKTFPAPRGLRWLGPIWRGLIARPLGGMAYVVMIGGLPDGVAAQIGLTLTDREQRRFDRIMRVVRVVMRVTPRPLRRGPLAIVIRRRAARHWRA